jgi:hypothetical protein
MNYIEEIEKQINALNGVKISLFWVRKDKDTFNDVFGKIDEAVAILKLEKEAAIKKEQDTAADQIADRIVEILRKRGLLGR